MLRVVFLIVLMAAIVPSVASSETITLVQVPVIELNKVIGDGGKYVPAEIRAQVAKSEKALVSSSGQQYREIASTQDRVACSGRYSKTSQSWSTSGQLIAPTEHYSITGNAGYYEDNKLRSLGAAILAQAINDELASASYDGYANGSVNTCRGRYNTFGGGRRSYSGYGYGNSGPVSATWKGKTARVDLVLEAPSTSTGLYGKGGVVTARGEAKLEDFNFCFDANSGCYRRYGSYGSKETYTTDDVAKRLIEKATDIAIAKLVKGLPDPILIGNIASSKSLVPGKSKVFFYRNNCPTPIASYLVLNVDCGKAAVWPVDEKCRPDPKVDEFKIVTP